jgi:CopG family transcriptional regulator, nickel-responsive regulator
MTDLVDNPQPAPSAPSARKQRRRVSKQEKVRRLSISLPESLFVGLESMVKERGYQTRSQAVSEMISDQLLDLQQKYGDNVMAGTITLVYNNTRKELLASLKEIQFKYIVEIVSSLHVHLEQRHSLEVLLVQGPASRLKQIASELITCKGIIHGKLNITSMVLPPLY